MSDAELRHEHQRQRAADDPCRGRAAADLAAGAPLLSAASMLLMPATVRPKWSTDKVQFMAIQWSGLGPELLLRLDRGSGQPLRSQLEAGLREAIRSGRLQGGERLPSSRELARELGVSRGLVQECYSQLLSEGYLTSQTGSATRVAASARTRHRAGAGQRGRSRRRG